MEKNGCKKSFFESIVIDQIANEKSSSVSNVVEDIINDTEMNYNSEITIGSLFTGAKGSKVSLL